ncbi:sigma 54-interacting transcriptional regulator [Rhodoferax saidenbachensis]|uniref:Sigma-54-specific transcriptional regulator n=1 Tax=Rhodoferax saidenbachensis TaxID=1484693 RepID=A0ABU1ZNF1_9BURK|nr:sigma 54-interacting transcriptional regulator [Rhodoferax saidenbachensis]MDR7307085.1 sigma-54-specific transcriptional regulator [Rhodoferax saidenbachensis]
MSASQLLTLPQAHALSVRAKALVFDDPVSLALLARVEQIAPSDATVLITGETGTGKELLARRVHQGSGRRGPFVAVNCGAFSESMIDAELFGHETGAFTGAHQARAGWFEAANHGTLFLDEIGDLPLHLQVKLLRVLQERQVVRLGSRTPIALDVRLVVATNVDLRAAVAAQRFRADLYYRLSVATLPLRPLHERPGDILPLARHFLDHYAQRLGRTGARLTTDAQTALLAHDWPGNIRELENVIHYALITAPTDTVRASDLQGLHRRSDAAVSTAPTPPNTSALDVALTDYLAQGSASALHDVEAALLRSAWSASGHNQVHTARLLGITRNAVRTLLKRHGFLESEFQAALT